jgi:hypothetical protein
MTGTTNEGFEQIFGLRYAAKSSGSKIPLKTGHAYIINILFH